MASESPEGVLPKGLYLHTADKHVLTILFNNVLNQVWRKTTDAVPATLLDISTLPVYSGYKNLR
jgi:hypothetical protein